MGAGDGLDLADPSRQLPDRFGPYELVGRLGAGGMGIVLDAVSESGDRVALKLIRPTGDQAQMTAFRARLLREARILQRLDHRGVVRLTDCGVIGDVVYLAMERIVGVTLNEIRARGPIRDVSILVSLAKQLSETLIALHDAGVIHRDIKPSNILVDASGRAILTDFGIAWMQGVTAITQAGQLLGSAGYVPPEVFHGGEVSDRSDQFALGRVLFEMAAVRPPEPISNDTPPIARFARRAAVDWSRFPAAPPWPGLAAIIRKMIAPAPNDRFASAREALALFLDFEEACARSLEPHPRGFGGGGPSAQPTVYSPEVTLHRLIQALEIPAHLPWITTHPSSDSSDPPEPLPRASISSRRDDHDPSVPDPVEARRERSSPGVGLIAIFALSLLSGLLFGETIHRSCDGASFDDGGDREGPRGRSYVYEAEVPPREGEILAARGVLEAAGRELSIGDVSKAEELLGRCVELADLAECHRKLAYLRFLIGDPSALESLERYVSTSTPSPDRARAQDFLWGARQP